MKKNAECILKPTVVTLQCFSATLNLRLHSRLVWSQYRYQSAISLQRFCTSKCTHTHTVVFPAERKCIGHHYFVPERRRFHLDSASSLYSSFSFSNNTHAKSPAESFSSRFLSHIHSSVLILDSPWPTYVLFPPPTHTPNSSTLASFPLTFLTSPPLWFPVFIVVGVETLTLKCFAVTPGSEHHKWKHQN